MASDLPPEKVRRVRGILFEIPQRFQHCLISNLLGLFLVSSALIHKDVVGKAVVPAGLPLDAVASALLQAHGHPEDRRHALVQGKAQPLFIELVQRRMAHKKHGKAEEQYQAVTQLFIGNHFYQQNAGNGRNDDIAVAPHQAGQSQRRAQQYAVADLPPLQI